MKVEIPNGHVYELTSNAILKLKQAKFAKQAEEVFEGFASHVPTSDRCRVWNSVDKIELVCDPFRHWEVTLLWCDPNRDAPHFWEEDNTHVMRLAGFDMTAEEAVEYVRRAWTEFEADVISVVETQGIL